MNKEKSFHEPLFRISKRDTLPWWKMLLAYAGLVLSAFVVILIVIWAVLGISPWKAIIYIFDGSFKSRGDFFDMMKDTSILLMIALALTPAFKMKYWNIGAEGQVLFGGFACVVCMMSLGGKIPEPLLIVIMFVASVVGGALWAVIPAIFKAIWKTNETLFTLMMNYIATQIVLYYIKVVDTIKAGNLPPQDFGRIPLIGGEKAWLCVISALLVTFIVWIYTKFTKHGYEMSIVGESENTARYIGVNVKKVVIRTLILSGAICGLVGFILVGGIDYTVSAETVGGRGFTAILVAWLAKLNPFIMILSSFLVVFLTRGTSQIMMNLRVANDFFSNVVIGLMFFMIIAGEFFIVYRVKIKKFDLEKLKFWKRRKKD